MIERKYMSREEIECYNGEVTDKLGFHRVCKVMIAIFNDTKMIQKLPWKLCIGIIHVDNILFGLAFPVL